MTTWHEYPEFARDFFAERNQGIAGYYSFQADFELVYDDWDPETDEETTSMGEKGESQIGSIECAAHDFQEFIEDAVRKLSIKFDIDLYPKRIPLKREIA